MYKIVLILTLNLSILYSFDLNSLLKSTQEYANQGKLLLLGETLKTAINNSLDTKTTKVEELSINSKNQIKMVVKLLGENKNFILNVSHFDWSISNDKKLIVFENIKYNGNIPWIEYIISYYFQITKGYITVKYSSSVETVLSTVKKPIKTTYDTNQTYSKDFWANLQMRLSNQWENSNKKDLTPIISSIFDKNFINITTLKIENKKIYFEAITKGSTKGLSFYIDDFSWKTINNKQNIIINNIKMKNCNKPWVIGSLKKRKNSIKFQYSNIVENILNSIKIQKDI